MVKSILFSVVLLVSGVSYAAECVDAQGNDITSDPTAFTELIEKSESCYAAAQLAEACAWGSSVDVQTAGTAYGICEAEFVANKPSLDLKNLLASMKKACVKRYEKEQGSLARAVGSYCHLTAIQFVNSLAGPF